MVIQQAPAQLCAGSPLVATACPLAEQSNGREPRAEFSASTLKSTRPSRWPADLFSSASVISRIDPALNGAVESIASNKAAAASMHDSPQTATPAALCADCPCLSGSMPLDI